MVDERIPLFGKDLNAALDRNAKFRVLIFWIWSSGFDPNTTYEF
jgi:hypothetical protein